MNYFQQYDDKPSFYKFLRGLFVLFLNVLAIYFTYRYQNPSFIIATVTLGDSSLAANDVLTYLDAVFSSSLSEHRSKLVDNIGATNSFLYKLLKSDFYESYEGGTDIRENLMYALAPSDWYDGYDELPDTPTDGITQAVFEARQQATPISYSGKETIQNKQQVFSLVKAKIMQGEMGIQEGFADALMVGSGTGALATPFTGSTGASAINPIARLIHYAPTSTVSIGGIDQGTKTWWRNNMKESSATTYDALLFEWLHLYNTCALGTGGPPDLILADQTTYELMSFAFWQKYRQTGSDTNFPFTNIRVPFGNGGTLMVMDDKVPDVYGGLTNTETKGTAYFINTKFFRIRYIPERDFVMLKDENGKTFFKPIKGDSRLGHLVWMGECTVNNRRKHGVIGNMARTLTA